MEQNLVEQPLQTPQDQKTPAPVYASFWRRYFAFSLDLSLVAITEMGISFSFSRKPFSKTPPTSITAILVDFLWPLVLTAIVTIICWVKFNGQTPGKWLMRIRIVKADHSPMDVSTAIIRYISYGLSSLAGHLGYLWMIFDAQKQTWHDKIAKTYVVETDTHRPALFAYLAVLLVPPVVIIAMLYWAMIAQNVIDSPNDLRALYDTLRIANGPRLMKPEVRTHYNQSDELMNQIKKLDPNDPNYSTKVRPIARNAIEELKIARDLDPKNALIYTSLGNAYGKLEGTPAAEKRYDAYKMAVELDSHNSRYSYNLGVVLFEQERYQEAVEILIKAIEQDDDNAQAYHVLGMSFEQLRQYDKAKENYETAIEKYKRDNQSGVFDKTIKEIQQTLTTLPQ